MNRVDLLGNLAKDPEVRYTKAGKAVASFTIATTNSYVGEDGSKKETTSFINCVTWGKSGEQLGNYKKGNRLFVSGRLQTRSYEAQDGTKRYVTEVVTEFVGAPLEKAVGHEESYFGEFAKDENLRHEELPF